MMQKQLFLAGLFALLLIACTEQLTVQEQAYKEYCAEKGGAWMKMSELKDGHPTGNTCYGCMPDEKNHICTKEEYEEFIK
jgi:hypothetical protein